MAGKGRDKAVFETIRAGVLGGNMLKAKVRGSGDMDGLTTWIPDRTFDDGEMEIKHTLGRRPEGFVLLRGTAAIRWWCTAEQHARWTAERVFIYPNKTALFETLEGDISAAEGHEFTVDFKKPLYTPEDKCHLMWGVGCHQNHLSRDFSIAIHLLDIDGNESSTPPFYGATLDTLSENPITGGGVFNVRCDLTIHPGIDDEFVLQFF